MTDADHGGRSGDGNDSEIDISSDSDSSIAEIYGKISSESDDSDENDTNNIHTDDSGEEQESNTWYDFL